MVKKKASRSTSGTRKLKLKKETVKNLTPRGQVKGGAATTMVCLGQKPRVRAASGALCDTTQSAQITC